MNEKQEAKIKEPQKRIKYCICQSIAGLKRAMDVCEITWLLKEDGTIASRSELIQAITDAEAKGYTVLPPCDNVTSTGHCAGHVVGGEVAIPASAFVNWSEEGIVLVGL